MDYPRNLNNAMLAVAPNFGDFLKQGLRQTMTTAPAAISPNTTWPSTPTPKEEGSGGLKGEAPKVFDGNWKNSKQFISELKIYFQVNRNKKDIKNQYSKTLIALFFIKGPNVLNWVDAQADMVNYDLIMAGGDEFNNVVWTNFLRRFQAVFISTTTKEDTYTKINKLKMKNGQLDKYMANHSILINELGWHNNDKMTCHTYRQGLPNAMVKAIITQNGMPNGLQEWIWLAEQQHAQYTMNWALGYVRRDWEKKEKTWTRPNTFKNKKNKNPDTMDVDWTQMDPAEQERLMKTSSCFHCKKQGHLAKDCPTKKVQIQEANSESQKKKEKAKQVKKKPLPYKAIIK